MMRIRISAALRPGVVGGLLALSALAVQARGGWSVDLGVSVPVGPYDGGPYDVVPGYGTAVPALPAGAVSVTVGGGRYWRHGGVWYRPWGPGWVVVAPPVVVPAVQAVVAAGPPPPGRPDPIIYPRNGQGARQTEADRQDCNRWATTQPQAVADAAQFQRAVEACMDGRGYTMK